MLDTLHSDIRIIFRDIVRHPVTSLAVISSLGLGIGSCIVFFRVINELHFVPLPVDRPERLVSIYSYDKRNGQYLNVSLPDYTDLATGLTFLADLAAYTRYDLNLRRNNRSEIAVSEIVTGNYMQVVGVKALKGRVLSVADAVSSLPVAVLSAQCWQSQFSAAADIVGKTVFLNDLSVTIIGVLDPRFNSTLRAGRSPMFYLPLSPTVAKSIPGLTRLMGSRDERSFLTIGRLRKDVQSKEVDTAGKTLTARLEREYPRENIGITARMRSGREPQLWPGQGESLFSALSAFNVSLALVVIVACGNVANLVLSRVSSRQHEFALRISLGASRWRLALYPILSSAVLTGLGLAAAMIFAQALQQILAASSEVLGVQMQLDFVTDWRVLAYVAAATMLIMGLCAYIPTLTVRAIQPMAVLRSGMQHGTALRYKNALHTGLLVLQSGVCIMMSLSAISFGHALLKAYRTDLHFAYANLAALLVDVGNVRFTKEQGLRFFEEARQRILNVPGVSEVSVSALSPLDPSRIPASLTSDDALGRPEIPVRMNIVGPQYFRTLGVHLIFGREFSKQDVEGRMPVVIINSELASRLSANGISVPRVGVKDGDGRLKWLAVVGIAPSLRHHSPWQPPEPYIYVPLAQNYSGLMNIIIRTTVSPKRTLNPVLQAINGVEPRLPISRLDTGAELMANAVSRERFGATLIAYLCFFVIVLSAVGTYSMLQTLIAARWKEIGIRMALGATTGQLRYSVAFYPAAMALLGSTIGAIGFLFLERPLASWFPTVPAADWHSFALSLFLFAVIFGAACVGPLTRVGQIHAYDILHSE